jgi:hypothetical protein
MRYADSTGSDEDHRYPHAWRYRDYVVKAFNDDMPYNQFVREQLAGDILAADPNSGVGLSRHRRHRLSGAGQEGAGAEGSAAQALRRGGRSDRCHRQGVPGLTVTCARCHDHKFDPIATKDYYAMAAIFASTLSYEKGEDGDPVQTPLAPAGQFEAFRKQWTDYLGVEKKIDKIIDFDSDAKKDRDKQEALIAASCWPRIACMPIHEPLTAATGLAKWVHT